MNDHYRALVIHRAGDLRIDRRQLTTPEPDQTVVAITHGGICGSDLHYLRHGAAGQSILRAPMVLGHEVVGRVENRGDRRVRPGRRDTGRCLPGDAVRALPGMPGRPRKRVRHHHLSWVGRPKPAAPTVLSPTSTP